MDKLSTKTGESTKEKIGMAEKSLKWTVWGMEEAVTDVEDRAILLENAQRQKVKGNASLAKAKESPDGKEKAKEAVRGGRKEPPAGD